MHMWRGRRLPDIERLVRRPQGSQSEFESMLIPCQVPGPSERPVGFEPTDIRIASPDALPLRHGRSCDEEGMGTCPIPAPSFGFEQVRRSASRGPQVNREPLFGSCSAEPTTTGCGLARFENSPPVLFRRVRRSAPRTLSIPRRSTARACRGTSRRYRGCCNGRPSRPNRPADA